MNTFQVVRLIAVLAAAAVLFGLGQGLGLQLYYAVPAAFVVYTIIIVTLGLLLKAEPPRQR